MFYKVEVFGEVRASYIVKNVASEDAAKEKVWEFLSEEYPRHLMQWIKSNKIRAMVFELSFDGDVSPLI